MAASYCHPCCLSLDAGLDLTSIVWLDLLYKDFVMILASLEEDRLAFEPCTCVWQIVHAWYWTAWLWNVGMPGAVKLSVTVWHCRQSVFTLLWVSSRAFWRAVRGVA